nr:hypothetical protein [Clostridia bacterium]
MKKIKFLLILTICLMMTFSLIACGKGEANNNAKGVIPTYQGMTIKNANYYENATNAFVTPNNADDVNVAENNIDSEEDVSEIDPHIDENLEDTRIDEIVKIDVITDDIVKYYVKPNEIFIVEVHIDNPNDYEIQSFTLNGKKYANYMFKEGSTMELLLLEVTAPATSGYIEYLIDAIKYIDGTEIKDVDMSTGEKTIKAGIAYTSEPNAVVNNEVISTTGISLDITINDDNNI